MKKIGDFLSFTEIKNFCPTENKEFSVPFKSRKFEGYKIGSFESKNRKFSK